jgi:SAM-dependent methyltransferase
MRTLSTAEIETLYRDRVQVLDEPGYLNRYGDFDWASRFNAETLRRMDFARLVTILEFERLVGEHDIRVDDVLMLNGGPSGDPELTHLPHERVHSYDYETDPLRGDLHTLHFADQQFDFVLFSQTLEHLYNPPLALDNVFAATRPGGWVWTSVPTVSGLHQLPFHFSTGLTPVGLAAMVAAAGFDVVDVGQWGNSKYISYLFDFGLIPTYYDLAPGSLRAHGYGHILRALCWLSPRNTLMDGRARNDFDTPAQTWILARRPV